jgi:cyclophilin family peptidyl-prolyl cis-trans isomerase
MKSHMPLSAMLVVLALSFAACAVAGLKKPNPKVLMQTSMGEITLELFADKAPVSVDNFIQYVNAGFYTNTVFHRVIRGFMIQGGGFDKDLVQKETRQPIENEAGNGLSNRRGTLSYARTMVVNSATSQFFINHADNTGLDHRDETPNGFGYAVFGKVLKGMDVVDKIAETPTGSKNGMQDVPVTPVLILSVKVLE